MAFGPSMEVQRENHSPIVLSAIEPSDLKQLPKIDSPESEPIRRYVTQAFIEEARTLEDPSDLRYYYEWKEPEDATWWGVYARQRRWSRHRLVGFTGYRGITTNTLSERVADSRTVLMNAHYLRQGIGRAAGMARTFYGLAPEGDDLDRIHARVDIRNVASYKIVRSLGYLCFAHTPPKGLDEPDYERHLVELRHPSLSPESFPAPFHEGESWGLAQLQTRKVLEQARRTVRFLGQ